MLIGGRNEHVPSAGRMKPKARRLAQSEPNTRRRLQQTCESRYPTAARTAGFYPRTPRKPMPQPLTFEAFRFAFTKAVEKAGLNWAAVGFLGEDDNVYPFGTDTKVISTVFECFASPILYEIADHYGYIVEGSPQTVYPDFTLSKAGAAPRIAIDIKTTYRDFTSAGVVRKFRYTLGSYTSFLRDPTKNIRYPYPEYSGHWVIGFLYSRASGVPAKVYGRTSAGALTAPYKDVEFFVQEKHKIVGETPGSGNTANIGSFATNSIDDLRQGCGPFASLGKDVCDEYWRHYSPTASKRNYNSVSEFLEWRKRQ
jgi:hypothetical protein